MKGTQRSKIISPEIKLFPLQTVSDYYHIEINNVDIYVALFLMTRSVYN